MGFFSEDEMRAPAQSAYRGADGEPTDEVLDALLEWAQRTRISAFMLDRVLAGAADVRLREDGELIFNVSARAARNAA